MAFDETIYLTLEGGIVNPISHVTGNYTTSNVVVYDGSTFRNLLDAATLGRAWISTDAVGETNPASSAVAEMRDDRVTATAPIYHGKQRTLWTFPRTVSGSAGFSHVVWGDLVRCSGSHPPYRIGSTPTVVS